MTTQDRPERLLRFDYNRGLPAGVQTAWGCRAIVDQNGLFDIVWDRTDAVGPRVEVLLGHLNGMHLWQETARLMLKAGEINTRADHEVILWQDTWVVIKANPQRSAGYLYVCAYLVEEVPS